MYKYDDLDIIVTSYGKQCLLETTDNEFKIASAMWAIETNTAISVLQISSYLPSFKCSFLNTLIS